MELQTIEQLWARHDWAGYTALAVFVGLALWKRFAADVWDLLPAWVQFAIPFVLVGGTAFAETLAKDQAATIVMAIFSGLGAGLGLIGGYHGCKRAPLVGRLLRRPPGGEPAPDAPPAERETDPPEEPPEDPPASTASLAGILLLGLLLAGCKPAKDASDAVANICEGYLANTAIVQAEADRRQGISPLIVAKAICWLNDGGRFVWELFSIEGPDGARTATPTSGLEQAEARAIAIARQQGELP